MNTSKTVRPLHAIASEIIMDMESISKAKGKYWRTAYPYAEPYIEAMMSLNTVDDKYMWDSGREIVCRFLSNASTWKGDKAKSIKKELKEIVGLK